MRCFDVVFDPVGRTRNDWANLAWFGVERVLAVPLTLGRARSTGGLLQAWDRWRTALAVGEASGVRVRPALRVGAESLPERTHDDLWLALRARAVERAAAIGPIGARDGLALLAAHASLARDADLPLLIDARESSPAWLGGDARVATEGSRRLWVAPPLGAMGGLLARGDGVVVDAGPDRSPELVAVVARLAIDAGERLFASGGGRASRHDVLSLPRFGVQLGEAGVPASVVSAIVWGNAARELG